MQSVLISEICVKILFPFSSHELHQFSQIRNKYNPHIQINLYILVESV